MLNTRKTALIARTGTSNWFAIDMIGGSPYNGYRIKNRDTNAVLETFIIDTEVLPDVKEHLDRHFANLTASALEPFVGKTLERINKIELGEVLNVQDWYVEEINVHLTALKGEEKAIVEKSLIPAFEKILPCSFHPVEWWPMENRDSAEPSEQGLLETLAPESIKGIFQRWFK